MRVWLQKHTDTTGHWPREWNKPQFQCTLNGMQCQKISTATWNVHCIYSSRKKRFAIKTVGIEQCVWIDTDLILCTYDFNGK